MITNTVNNFEEIVVKRIPLIDVRAPIEFNKGAFLNSVNLPIMNDEERSLVGTCYKEKGGEEAVKLGHQLVSGKVRQARIDVWVSHINKYPDSIIYCFRGGMRSAISQQWIFEATGKEIAKIEGGYKAFRNYLIKALESSEQQSIPILLGGYTGSGKTRLLKKLKNSIDLEGMANHRGSSFGRYITSQPTQINFENNLAYAIIANRHNGYRYIVLEDENPNIGKNYIPKPLFEYFNSGDMILIDVPFGERVYNTMNEYVIESQVDYIGAFGREQGLMEWFQYISCGINKIKNRLGGERYKQVADSFEFAYKHQMLSGDHSLHKNWIEIILKEYYDPMYHYQMQTTTKKVLFRGNLQEVLEYLINKEGSK